jgi:hypothetical protein
MDWLGLIWVMAMLITHEWGHYLMAKSQGIYKGVAVIPFGVAIQMTSYLKSRWDYLAGIVTSCLAFPLFWLFEPTLRGKWWFFFVFAISIGVVDILVCVLYDPIIKDIKEREARGEVTKNIGIQIWGDENVWNRRKQNSKKYSRESQCGTRN